MAVYPLPNHPSLTSKASLGLCGLDDENVEHFELLRLLINNADYNLSLLEAAGENFFEFIWNSTFKNFLHYVASNLHGKSNLDANGLDQAHFGQGPLPRQAFRTNLFHAALQLETLFPNGNLLQLSSDNESATFSPAEMDCLLAHMFLGTLQMHKGTFWGRPGLTHYYAGGQYSVVGNTALPYLDTIIDHFRGGGYAASMKAHHRFTFEYSHATSMPEVNSCTHAAPRLPVKLVDKPTDPSGREGDLLVLVAANAEPGPGAGGTHEERLVGQSPALAIAAILVSLLAKDAAVVTSPLPVHASWEGHGRDAKMLSLLPSGDRPVRRYIVADALALDLSHRQPALLKNNVDREIRKLYAAFNGARRSWESAGLPVASLIIEMPPWGCGAFGGSLKTKMPCMIIAAGLAGLTSKNLELLVPRDHQRDLWQPIGDDLSVSELYSRFVGANSTPNGLAAYLPDLIKRAFS